MKLRKALDKANDKRRDIGLHEVTQNKRTARKNGAIWTPPSYSTSRFNQINPDIAKENRCISIDSESRESESFKVLRAKIQQQMLQHGKRIVLITSPTPGDGKTLTATNLALTFAKSYSQTVLLADCDLKYQSIHKMFGIESDLGLQNYLVDETPLENIIIWPGIEKLSLISGGGAINNSAEVLGSPRMKALAEEFESRYEDRVVVLDSPPILGGADTLALVPIVDCIILVVAEGKTAMKDIKQAIDMLPSHKLAGIVMNRQKYGTHNAYYYGPDQK